MAGIAWDIRREGRRWRPGELRERYEALPEMKVQIIEGQLPWDDGAKLVLLGTLLESVGAHRAVRATPLRRSKTGPEAGGPGLRARANATFV